MSQHTTTTKMPCQQIFVHTGAQPSSRLVNQAGQIQFGGTFLVPVQMKL